MSEVLGIHTVEAVRRAKKNGTKELDELAALRNDLVEFEALTQKAQKPNTGATGDYYTPVSSGIEPR